VSEKEVNVNATGRCSYKEQAADSFAENVITFTKLLPIS